MPNEAAIGGKYSNEKTIESQNTSYWKKRSENFFEDFYGFHLADCIEVIAKIVY